MPNEVTDPAVLAQLNGQEITDPTVLAQLNNGPVDMNRPLQNNPFANQGFGANYALGAGQLISNIGTAAQERWAQITGNQTRLAQLQSQIASDRQLTAPLDQSAGGKLGQLTAGAALGALVPGAGTVAGGAALGGALGYLTPTTGNESVTDNTLMGGLLGAGSAKVSGAIGNWIKGRSAEAIMPSGLTPAQAEAAQQGASLGMSLTPGQQAGNKALLQFEAKLRGQPGSSGPFTALDSANQQNANAIAAQSVGMDSQNLDKTVLRQANARFSQIFGAARSPENFATIDDSTQNVVNKISADLNTSTASALKANGDVQDLLGGLGTDMNSQKLGQITSNLGNEANRQMTSQGGDRALGRALFAVKEHVDDLIGSSIQDPDVKAAYDAARPQYRNFLNLTNGKITNPSTGNVNMTALASRLQKVDRQGYLYGKNQSPLYQAAGFGQAFLPVVGDSGTATRSMGLGNMAMQIPAYLASRAYMNPVAGPLMRAPVYAGGAVSRALLPFQSTLQGGLPVGMTAAALPYLTQ
jgi:hypothetical protein